MTARKSSTRSMPGSYLRYGQALTVILLAGLCLFLLKASHSLSLGQTASVPIKRLLNQDGTLKLNTGFTGVLDLRGWDVKLDAKSGPILTRQNQEIRDIDTGTTNTWTSNSPHTLPNVSQTASWSALSNNGLDEFVKAFIVIGNDLYVGGGFSNTYDRSVTDLNGIARYSNGAWSPLANQGLGDIVNGVLHVGVVEDLAVMGSDLYVGGHFDRAYDGSVTNLHNIARYSNGAWSPLTNQGLDDAVYALAVMGSDLYVGGYFNKTYDGSVTDLNNIARYSNGTWSPLANQGLDGAVWALAVMGSDLYVGGGFHRTYDGAVTDLNDIARYSNGTWSPLANQGLGGVPNVGVEALAVMGSDLYVGGSFIKTYDGSVSDLTFIARYSNGTWSPLPNRGLDSIVHALAVIGSDLYVGGHFDSTADNSVEGLTHIARYSNGTWSPLPNRGLVEESYPLGRVLELAVMGSDLYVGGFFDKTDVGSVTNLNNIAVLTDAASPAPTPTPQVCPIQASSSNEADTDGDGLLDCWETDGYDIDGDGVVEVNLPAMGADPNYKDIFVEIDYMESATQSLKPDPAAIKMVVDAFNNAPVDQISEGKFKGIHLHVDYGSNAPLTWGKTSTWGALSQSNILSNQTFVTNCTDRNPNWNDIDKTIKDSSFVMSRRPIFHYNLWVYQICNSLATNSGVSRGTPASDFIVSIGSWSNRSDITLQAGTFMHELGHNLGLCHGGPVNLANPDNQCAINFKPNYLSMMNYSFQTKGLIAYNQQGIVDYSIYALPDLNEDSGLDETIGIGLPAQYKGIYGTIHFCDLGKAQNVIDASKVDWNCDTDILDTNVRYNVNEGYPWDQDNTFGTLKSYDDWNNLIYKGGAIGQLGGNIVEPILTELSELTEEQAAEIPTLPLPYTVFLPVVER